MKKIAVLGSTGSIGKNTLKVVKHLGSFEIVALAAHSDITLLETQALEFKPKLMAVFDEKKGEELKKKGFNIVTGAEGLIEVATRDEVDLVVMAITGKQALRPTIEALRKKKNIALASKEVLVSGGKWLTDYAKEMGVSFIPIDSEHNALFQMLQGEKKEDVRRLILTASGGPFRTKSEEELKHITIEEALNHPTWKMGPKVTIDSSTLMNKSLEVMEAHYLFDIPPEKIEVVIHPQSIIHSFVEFEDGTMKAIMNEPDMCFPIQHALTYPNRKKTLFPPFDFTKHERLEFFMPDNKKFPTLNLANFAIREGKSYPCYLNAINDVLVARFLNREIPWKGIIERLETLLNRHAPLVVTELDTILEIDRKAREDALKI